jgi:DNA replication and repair protein RecF
LPGTVNGLELTGFRNYRSASITFSPGINLVTGANGQGKTNLLEAIALLSIGRSIRGATDARMITWDETRGILKCTLSDDAPLSTLEMILHAGERKELRIDGAPLANLSELVGQVRTVTLMPEVIDDQFRSVAGRRRMLDILASQADRVYLEALKRHRGTVRGLNALYKQPSPNTAELDVWEQQLAVVSFEVAARRRELVEILREPMAGFYRELFGGGGLTLRMTCSLPVEDSVDACVDVLKASRPQALKQGFVMRGAHRDRVEVLLDGRSLESHASQGQTKGAYFAWKLAEGAALKYVTGSEPLWLVDDPFSEMDRQRSLALLEMFESRKQVILTTPRDADLDLTKRDYMGHVVRDGMITAAN